MTRMTPLLRSVCLIALGFGCAAGASEQSDSRAQLIGATRKLHDAMAAGNVGTLETLLASEYMLTDSKGRVHPRGDVLGTARRHDVDLERTVSELTDLRVTVVRGTGVVTGIAEERLSFTDREERKRRRFTEVWIGGDTGWQLMATHESGADFTRAHTPPASSAR